jgi:Protein of unknown function (DUF4235)
MALSCSLYLAVASDYVRCMDESAESDIGRQRIWRLVSATVGILGAVVAKRLLRAAYRAVRGDEPVSAFDPTSDRFSWGNAFVWAIAAGIGLVLAKMLGDRVAALGWKAATGTPPPRVG